MGLFKYIDFRVFFISLIFGLFAVYITAPDKRKIYVYPTPENIDVLQYKDKSDTCFSLSKKEVSCPKNQSEITKIPLQG